MNQPKEIKIDDVAYVRADCTPEPDVSEGKPYVIVRSREQGVVSGYLKECTGRTITLLRARQLWYWKSRFVLADLAEFGPSSSSACKFSAEMSQPMTMLEACGIYHCTASAGTAIRNVAAQVK